MKKLVFASVMALATISLVSVPTLRAQDSDQITIKDQGEFDAYVTASSQSSPRAKAAALESFLQRYPESAVKKLVLDVLVDTYQSLNDHDNALSAASRLLQLDPNNMKAIYTSVVIKKRQCTETQDAQACNDAAALGQEGLAVTKPANVSAEDWKKLIGSAYPIFRSAIALGQPTSPATPKMTNDEVIQLVSAGLSEQVVATSIRHASNKGFDLTTTGLIALKKAGVSDALIAVMQERDAPAQAAPASEASLPAPALAPPSAPDNGCSDIDFMGVFQEQVGPGVPAWIYTATIRNRATYAKEVDIEYVKNGQAAKGTFNVGAGQKINAQLDLNNNPPTNVRMTACR
jgi:hypothetical protein